MIWTILIIITLAVFIYLIHNVEDDPCYKCPVYKYEGCPYVDGPYCNMKNCPTLDKWNMTHVVAD